MAKQLIESSEKDGKTTVPKKAKAPVPNNDGILKNRRFTDYLVELNPSFSP